MHINKALYFLILVFISSCANRVPPTGGPKDKTPPNLIGSIPKDGSINVKTKEISLLFDELVVTKNITKELLITPRIDFDYTYKTKKNTIIISLEEPLDSATTYTFNFRKGIVDITEGNAAQNLILSFSTGPVLDTLQISGTVQDLYTQQPYENAIVGLYSANDTLDLFNSPPYYLAQTNKKGQYTFRNIKSDQYKLYAFIDSNNNLMCQSDREKFGFQDSIIMLDTNKIIKPLKLQHMNMDTLKLKRTRANGQYFIAVANKALLDQDLRASNDSLLRYSLDKEKKEIKIYKTFPIKDSLQVYLNMTDSLYNSRLDTFYISFPESQRPYDQYESKLIDLNVYPESKKIKFTITTNKPSLIYNQDSIHIKLDTLLDIPFDSTWNIIPNKTHTQFAFSNTLPKQYLDSLVGTIETRDVRVSPKEKKKPKVYTLNIPYTTVISIESDTSKTFDSKLTPNYSKDFGLINGSIQTEYKHFTIQLLDKKFNVVQEASNKTNYKFEYIPPGEYQIRIIIDENNNGRWDPGNIFLNQLPEPIFIYKDSEGKSLTTIRANWVQTIDLTF